MDVKLACSGCTQRDRRIAELEKNLGRLQAELDDLRSQLDQAQRASKRQAAPFSKGNPKTKPKSTARPSGDAYGKHGHRLIPADADIDETLEAPLPDCCPHCGGNIAEDDAVDEQFQEEIPVKPLRRKIRIHKGTCRDCGRRVRGRHAKQTSDAVGAAASQIGPDAQATITYLNKHGGMSYGKIADLFQVTYGIHLTRSACAQAVLRAGRRLQPAYEEIQQQLREAKHITPDESGWRLGGQPVWVHAAVADNGATLYVISPHRSADALEQVIGIHWSGSMTHDGYSTYNRFQQDVIHQQCVDHALRRAKRLVDKQTGAACDFPQQVIDLFTAGLKLRDQLNQEHADPDRRGEHYLDYTQRLRTLTETPTGNQDNDRFAKHLHQHVAEWFPFLLDPGIPATNHRAEQALKIPIVNRKVWGGNRTAAGKDAQEVDSSVIATCKKSCQSVITFISQSLCGFVGRLFASPATPDTG